MAQRGYWCELCLTSALFWLWANSSPWPRGGCPNVCVCAKLASAMQSILASEGDRPLPPNGVPELAKPVFISGNSTPSRQLYWRAEGGGQVNERLDVRALLAFRQLPALAMGGRVLIAAPGP